MRDMGLRLKREERRGTREEEGTSRVGIKLVKRYARVAGECLTKANMRRRGERTM